MTVKRLVYVGISEAHHGLAIRRRRFFRIKQRNGTQFLKGPLHDEKCLHHALFQRPTIAKLFRLLELP